MVRCKMVVNEIKRSLGGRYVRNADGKEVWTAGEVQTICMNPVSSGSPENKAFFASTPSGRLEVGTVNPEVVGELKLGGEYYIDISEAPASS